MKKSIFDRTLKILQNRTKHLLKRLINGGKSGLAHVIFNILL